MAEPILAHVRQLLSRRSVDPVDIEQALDEVYNARERCMTRRVQAARQQQLIASKVEELTVKARFALQEGREDLAESALDRQVDLEDQSVELDQVQLIARAQEVKLDECLAALRERRTEMAAFLAAAGSDHAMIGADPNLLSRIDKTASKSLAEIDLVQKGATVAARLAALKQESGRAA